MLELIKPKINKTLPGSLLHAVTQFKVKWLLCENIKGHKWIKSAEITRGSVNTAYWWLNNLYFTWARVEISSLYYKGSDCGCKNIKMPLHLFHSRFCICLCKYFWNSIVFMSHEKLSIKCPKPKGWTLNLF